MKILKLLLLASLVAVINTRIAQAQNKKGFVSLFDGKTLNGWKSLGAKANFSVVDGVIVDTIAPGFNQAFLVADKEYGDYVLEFDVKIVGAGIHPGSRIHGAFNFETKAEKDMASGKSLRLAADSADYSGIWDIKRGGFLYTTDLNPSAKSAFKKGEYNHVKIESIGNETKTWLNGTALTYMVDTVANTGAISLEVSAWSRLNSPGKKVCFKNIRIKTKDIIPAPFPAGVYVLNLQSNKLNDYEKQNGWKLLFDGSTPGGWHTAGKTTFPQKGWDIADGLISVNPPAKDQVGGGDILSAEQYSAFDLSFEFKTTPAANSGVKYFVTVDEKNVPLGLEYQVLDNALNPDARLGRDGDRTESSLYDLIPAKIPGGLFVIKPVGQWNTGRIIVYPDNHVEHYLNGVKVLEYDRLSPEFKALIAISKYKNYKGFGIGPKGYILLQDHGCAVSYRSIKIREL